MKLNGKENIQVVIFATILDYTMVKPSQAIGQICVKIIMMRLAQAQDLDLDKRGLELKLRRNGE